MFKKAKTILAASVAVCLVAFLVIGCGNTDGGSAVDNTAGLGIQYVSDGGAGGSISIDVRGNLTVGNTVPFMVTVLDASGQPLTYTKVYCDSEKGVAIVEPSTGTEHTDSYGHMSGVLGGDSPGSYFLECRAPVEYNLVARTSVKVTGTAPTGFTGFSGAAGGTLGGGLASSPTTDGIAITSIKFTDLGQESHYIDMVRDTDCDGDDTTDDPEPYYVNTYKVAIYNGSSQAVAINSITFTVDGVGQSTTTTQEVSFQIPAKSTTQYEGAFTGGAVGATNKVIAGTSVVPTIGEASVGFTVTGTMLSSSDEVSTSGSGTVDFDNIDNCE